jgi:hypothetical protein
MNFTDMGPYLYKRVRAIFSLIGNLELGTNVF